MRDDVSEYVVQNFIICTVHQRWMGRRDTMIWDCKASFDLKLKWKIPHGRPSRRWADNIKMEFKTEKEGLDLCHLRILSMKGAKHRDQMSNHQLLQRGLPPVTSYVIITVFRDAALCSAVETNHRFGWNCSLNLQGTRLHGFISRRRATS
jgi:hypothetical protein